MTDSMQDGIEQKVRGMLLASDDAGLLSMVVSYRGEPNIVPARLFPFNVVWVSRSQENYAGQDGYGPETNTRYWRHDLYLAFEVLTNDTSSLAPADDRTADVASYVGAKDLAKAGLAVLKTWNLDDDPVQVTEENGATNTTTGDLYYDEVVNVMTSRTPDTMANRAQVSVHLYSREDLIGGL